MADKQTVSIEPFINGLAKEGFILSGKDSEEANFIVSRSHKRNVGFLTLDEIEKSPFF